MHWILTIFLLYGGHPMIDHQEYYDLHHCQMAATAMKNQWQQLHGGFVVPAFTCTPTDDMSH